MYSVFAHFYENSLNHCTYCVSRRMTGARLDVLWSPVHQDKFITWGTEVCLYETLPRECAPKSACKCLFQYSFITQTFLYK